MDGRTILVCDDSSAMRSILRAQLASTGARVLEASSGAAALELLATANVDTVLLDIDMPGLSGFDVLAILRADPRHRDVPVVFLTARSGVRDLVDGLALGANDYLSKPWNEDELRARVAVALRLKQQTDALRRRNEELAQEGRTDALTGLPNRRWADETRGSASPPSGVVAMIDVDRFKAVNDTLGHEGGDAVLQVVAQRLRAAVGPDGLLARFGGEEFVYLAPGATLVEGLAVAERMRRTVGFAAVPIGTTTLTVTVSVGVAEGNLADPETLAAADRALLDAKAQGRNRVVAAPETAVPVTAASTGALPVA